MDEHERGERFAAQDRVLHELGRRCRDRPGADDEARDRQPAETRGPGRGWSANRVVPDEEQENPRPQRHDQRRLREDRHARQHPCEPKRPWSRKSASPITDRDAQGGAERVDLAVPDVGRESESRERDRDRQPLAPATESDAGRKSSEHKGGRRRVGPGEDALLGLESQGHQRRPVHLADESHHAERFAARHRFDLAVRRHHFRQRHVERLGIGADRHRLKDDLHQRADQERDRAEHRHLPQNRFSEPVGRETSRLAEKRHQASTQIEHGRHGADGDDAPDDGPIQASDESDQEHQVGEQSLAENESGCKSHPFGHAVGAVARSERFDRIDRFAADQPALELHAEAEGRERVGQNDNCDDHW